MSIAAKSRQTDLELFEPRPDLVYSIESVEHITRLSRRRIALYYKYGFISPVVNPDCGGYYFNDEAIRTFADDRTFARQPWNQPCRHQDYP